MLSAQQLKMLTSLQVKKYRQKYRMFALEGAKLVEELLGQQRIRARAVYGTAHWASEHAALAERAGALFQPISEGELRKISSLTTPPGVLAVAELPDFQPSAQGPAFYLDGIRDPGNLGAILRVADWFGFSAVYCSPDCADAFSPKVVQASMGAILRVPVAELPLAQLLPLWGARPVAGAVLDGDDVFSTPLPDAPLLVVGNESEGIRPETAQHLTHRLTIPRAPGSRTESLNAAVAAGILAALLLKR
ncbi:MAG: RNA methyltransferase [Saprospiraceae bacterium]|nr:RNA methyltransferase [Saprospiraceae bacterium]MDW8228850.1 RNA methyltransferase [Saprospiraceae bacterium]